MSALAAKKVGSIVRRSLAIRIGTLLCPMGLGVHALPATAQTSTSRDAVIEALRERIEALWASRRLSVKGTPFECNSITT